MEAAAEPPVGRKKMTKQLTGKREDTALHSAARAGNIASMKEIFENSGEEELADVLVKQNFAGETALYVAAEYGYVDLVGEMIKYYDLVAAGIKAKNGFDALHIAAKQGDLGAFHSPSYPLNHLCFSVILCSDTKLKMSTPS